MLFYCRKRSMAYVLGVLAVAALFFFGDRLLLRFQIWRLEGLKCSAPAVVGGFSTADGISCPKFWAHRVNSGERFGRLSKLFAGLETDVVFDPATGTFDVHHPPAPPSGLLLDSFLAQLSGTGMQLWVDLKDLQVADIPAALEAFAAYDGRYGIRDNIVVESSLPEFADALAERGFRTSFLVPPVYLGEESYPDEKSYPGEGSYPDEERGSDKESRPDNDPDGWPPALPSISPRVAYVSQDARYLEQLKSLYPNRKILTWSLAFHNYVDRNNLRLLAADTSVAVVLLNVKSRPYR